MILDWLAERDRTRDRKLLASAVADPTKISDDDAAEAIQQLGARFASKQAGRPIAPDEIEAISVRLTPEERASVAAAAEQQMQRHAQEVAAALENLHIIEALMLVRAFLPPLRPMADSTLKTTGVYVGLSADDWREVGIAIVDRLIAGQHLDPSASPRDAADALAAVGVLKQLA